MKLSIIIPAHNEEATIVEVIKRVLAVKLSGWEKEIIVVNDGSTDQTGAIINQTFGIRPIHHKVNLGKGSAIQTALKSASGEYVVIQDADLEYFPEDLPKLLNVLPEGRAVNSELSPIAVFGARGYKAYPERGFHYVVGAWLLTFTFNLFYRQRLSDLYTGYKLIPTQLFKALNIQSKGFEFEAEVACKLAKNNAILKEISINYKPRSKAQGKHIGFFDAFKGLWKIIVLRFYAKNS